MNGVNEAIRRVPFAKDSFAIKFPQGTSLRGKLSQKMFVDLTFWGDISGIIIIGLAIEYYYLTVYLAEVEKFSFYPLCMLMVAATMAIGLKRQKYHDDLLRAGPSSGYFQLFLIVVIAFGCALIGLFALKLSEHFSRVWFISWLATSYVFLAASQRFWRIWFRRLMATGHFRMNVAVIGSRAALPRALSFLGRNGKDRAVNLVGVYGIDMPAAARGGEKVTGLKPQLARLVRDCQRKHVTDVIVALSWPQWHRLGKLVRELQSLPVNISVVPDATGWPLNFRPVTELSDMKALAVSRTPISEWGVFLKRVEDYLIAAVAIVLFMPVMAIIAVLIKLDSPGPVFFRQRRHGFNHEIIEILKFRTMTVREDGPEVRQATRNDPRVTRVGRVLRSLSLDELPQFFNVLAGQMSIVGPRPHALAHNNHYEKLLNNYASRHRVKPGITGWAQINGFRGEVLDQAAMKERIRLDLEYIDNWALWFDVKILVMTPFYGFVSKNAY